MGTGGLFPGGKARPERDADHSPPYSAEVVNELPWCVVGLLYFFYYTMNLISACRVDDITSVMSLPTQQDEAIQSLVQLPVSNAPRKELACRHDRCEISLLNTMEKGIE
jgi:hypothetical protein